MKLAILGAGAWGTALAIAWSGAVSARGRPDPCVPVLWTADPQQAQTMEGGRENARYLPGIALPSAVCVSADFGLAIADADLAVIATPLAGLRTVAQRLAGEAPTLPFLWVCKGLESQTGLLPHQVVAQVCPPQSRTAYGALSGPSFAQEVAQGLPTAVTLASADPAFAARWSHQLHTPALRIYAQDDLVGVEVGGAIKNVLAIAVGLSDGLGLGLNARAALMTRGLAEMTRLGVALGARRETFTGLAGVGDLMLTCTGDLSRNRRVGLALAAGRQVEDIKTDLGHVAEGLPASAAIASRARQLGVDMPIVTAVYAVVEGKLTPRQAADALMQRHPGTEF
jgi:glycerol-3-phosphate dehydrogenase (NAD(P)+)